MIGSAADLARATTSPPSIALGSLIIPFWFYAIVLLILGGIVGSFLNVVVYRLPRGMSLLWPGSRCPSCGAAIRWHDNLPVIGWLLLRGRCRDCRARISPRYPLVEAFVAAGFLLIGIANPDSALLARGETELFVRPSMPLLFLHLSLFFILMVAALIRFDRSALPTGLVVLPTVLVLIVAIRWPGIVPNQLPLYNVLAAGLFGLLLWPACGHDAVSERLKSCGLLICIGLCLGWAAISLIAAAAAWLQVGSRAVAAVRLTWPVWLPAGMLVWLMMAPRLFKPDSAAITWMLYPAVAAAVATLLIRLYERRKAL